MKKPNVLFIMCDQFRFDAIASLGNGIVKTPNIDRLVKRGISFKNAYSTCPVCVPARYTIRTGSEPYSHGYFKNAGTVFTDKKTMEERCGDYIAKAMSKMGYYTFGIGKFHACPYNEDLGYDYYAQSEELYVNMEQRNFDAYASFIADEHPEYSHIEQLHGERTEMYYMPQMSPLPADLTVEAWAAGVAKKQITQCKDKPYFGFVSFIGPHPPCAPPVPFNRIYNPDNIPNPVKGNIDIDHADDFLPWMNYLIWAEDINDSHARVLKARYYGEITYIDTCIGKILDAVVETEDADNTLICFFSDHGDHLGDHHSWQKESFFDGSCRIPFILSWPARFAGDTENDALVSLAELFSIATGATGNCITRDGIDILGVLEGKAPQRELIFGFHETPGTIWFKLMVKDKRYKYIYIANGGRELLFDNINDKNEHIDLSGKHPELTAKYRGIAVNKITCNDNLSLAVENNNLKQFEFSPYKRFRIHQFDLSKGIKNFDDIF